MANNRSLLSGIADRVKRGPDPGAAATSSGAPTGEASAGHLAANLDGVTNPRAPGQRQAKIQRTDIQRLLWVDPKVCRLWAHHNREYSLLSEDRCDDLIAGFRAQGRQQRAAIVRSLSGDDRVGSDGIQYDFEIISGARRHWTVSWLRSRDETNKEGDPFLFLVQVRDDLNVTGASAASTLWSPFASPGISSDGVRSTTRKPRPLLSAACALRVKLKEFVRSCAVCQKFNGPSRMIRPSAQLIVSVHSLTLPV